MELLYIWIEDYKNIKRQGFNFSAQYRFEFDYQLDEKGETVTGGELKVTDNQSYIENFFGENITNVTAIVGENGSGKSSVLGNIFVLNNGFNLFIDNNKIIFYCQSFNLDKLKIQDNTLKKKIERSRFISKKSIDKAHILYYNNVLDISDLNDIVYYFPNLSLTYEIYNSLSKTNDNYNFPNIFKFEQVKKQFEFITYFFDKRFSFIPESIVFRIGKKNKSDMDKYLKIINTIPKSQMFHDEMVFEVVINPKTIEKLQELFKIPDFKLDFDLFTWHNLSSGENALLTLFSRFYYEYVQGRVAQERIIILIDEGELGMHPQWQKQYLQNILTVLPQIFKDKNLQFILTSHSPFLVSDLPKDHIIFLEKGEDGSCQVKNSLNEMKQTFGANIHTLLTDSFFMTGGLMGEFAKEKIRHLINYINRENLDKCKIKTDEQAQQYLNIIGEPIIKNFLQKQLDSRRLERVEKDHDARIKYLEEELERLRNNKQA